MDKSLLVIISTVPNVVLSFCKLQKEAHLILQ